MNLSIEQINDILNDLWNLHLVLFGVSISIFTLLYSFILSKRDELRSISDQVKNGNSSPILAERESFAIKYIIRLKSANNHAAVGILLTSILFAFTWITHRLIPDGNIHFKWLSFIAIALCSMIIVLYIGYIFLKVYIHYKSETKI